MSEEYQGDNSNNIDCSPLFRDHPDILIQPLSSK